MSSFLVSDHQVKLNYYRLILHTLTSKYFDDLKILGHAK